MGEQTSKTSQNTSAYAASSDRAARAYAVIMQIASDVAAGGDVSIFRGYAEAVGVFMGAGGWTYSGVVAPHSTALAQGWKRLARKLADKQYGGITRAMAEHYERSMPADAIESEKRKLDGYCYDADHLPRPLDIVQLAHGAIGVVERVNFGGDVLIRANDVADGILTVYDANALRSVPPVAFEAAGVPDAIRVGYVPRDYATGDLSRQAVMRARRIAPDARLTLAAIKVDDRHEYARGFVYAIASILDATRLIVADCPNKNWHESAPARRLQPCASCGTILNAKPACPEPEPVVEPDISALVGQARAAVEQLAVAAYGQVAVIEPKRERDPAHDDDVAEIVERLVRRAQYLALRAVLDTLEGWREGARSNHDAQGHRSENAGQDCWEHWHSSDIRTMVADAARELRTADPNDGHTPTDLSAPS